MKEELRQIKSMETALDESRDDLVNKTEIKNLIDATKYNFEPIPTTLPPLTVSGLSVLDRYLTYPTIIDIFDKHTERRKWRNSLPVSTQEMYDKNALRISNAGVTLNAVDFIIQEPRLMELFKEEKENLFTELLDGWTYSEEYPDGVYTVEEKMDYIENKLKPFLLRVREAAINK